MSLKSSAYKQDFLDQFLAIINSSQYKLIVVHEYPDLDAIGSALSMAMALNHQGHYVSIWVPETLKQSFQFLPNLSMISKRLPEDIDYDCVIFMDASHKERIPHHHLLDPILEKAQSINLDHHCDNSHFANLNCVMDISSVGEMMALLCEQLNWVISSDMATCLYAAICFDTGRFAYSNTSSQTMHFVAKLLDTGICPNEIYQAMYENKSLASFKLLNLALERLIVCEKSGYAYTSIPLSAPKAAFKIVDFIRQLKGIDVFIVFQAISSTKVKVNLRSKTHFDVSRFANQFGGGGHARAAGLAMLDKALEDCISTVIKKLDQALT
eukprot:COSAG01_NODE_6_length_54687_cov_500.907599_12_plen_325_part_00